MDAPELDKVEILDVLWASDDAGERVPVRRADAVERLRASGQDDAAALVEAMPAPGGVLDEQAVNEVFLAVHLELARLSEFMHVPQRIGSVLEGLVATVRERSPGRIRVVDVGCGIGYDLRVLADSGHLGPDVEYVGLDFNGLLVEVARRLAKAEDVPARFERGDALDPALSVEDPERTIMISSGVLHHLGPAALPGFLQRHDAMGIAAFAHFDVNPGIWANLGAWMLHQARMREPVSRHDGSMSMRRSMTSEVLLALAREGVGDAYQLECETVSTWRPQPDKIVRPLQGVRV